MRKATVVALGAVLALGAAPAARADDAAVESLMKKSNCFKCHAIDKKKDGPPFKETAAKYKGKPDAEATIYKFLTDPNGDHPEYKGNRDEAKIVIKWILQQ